MKIFSSNNRAIEINSIVDWRGRCAPKGKDKQWKENRSAKEMARFWTNEKHQLEFNSNATWTQTKKATGIVLSYYAHFTNPTHWVTFMKEYKGDWSVFIDIISRIFIGLGLYQTIQAFRKYGRF